MPDSIIVDSSSGVIVGAVSYTGRAGTFPVDPGFVEVAQTEPPMLAGGTCVNGIYMPASLPPPPPQQIVSQNLMAQFTADDAAKIQAAVGANPQFWLLWSAMQTQKDPMEVGNARFRAGWSALVAVLGADRMAAIAAALGVTVV